ncbi:MAG: TolC family protein [Bacteroidetes bacterium]|nr:TolC family protein [Bacteroidota bacterium]MBL6962823.1 TolC family protein [Bacteroidota bacterium]
MKNFYSICVILLLSGILISPRNIIAQEALSLSDCIEYALQQNISIRQNKLDIDQKQSELLQSKAAMLPSINGYINQGLSFGNSLDYTTYEYVKDRTNSNYFQLSSNFTVFNGFNLQNRVKSSQYALQSSNWTHEDIKDQVAMNVALAYLQILLNIEQLKLAEEQIDLTKGLLERIKILVDVGQETKSKELELKAELANNEVSHIEAKNNLEQSYLQLKQILNWEISKPIKINTYDINLVTGGDYDRIDIETVINNNVAELPKVKKAKSDLASTQFYYKSVQAMKYPSLELQSSMGTRYSSLINPLTGQKDPYIDQLDNNLGQYLTFGLQIPLFNNLRNSGAAQIAQLNIKNAELAYLDTEVQSKNVMYETYFLMINAGKKYEAAIKSQEAQRLLFDQSTLMYKEGMLNFYEWQSSRNNLSQAETSLLSAKYDYLYRIKVFDYYRGVPLSL